MDRDAASWPVARHGSGPSAVLMLHGLAGSKGDWSGVAEVLGRTATCLMPDLPGHGQHIDIDHVPEFPDLMRTLEQLREHEGVDRWHLVGYSMGGRLALAYALAYPERVQGLVMVSASPGIEDPDARRARRESDEAWAQRMESEPPGNLVEAWYQQSVFASLQQRTDILSMLRRERAQSAWPLVAEALRAWGQGLLPPAWSRLPSLGCRSLWIAGALDARYAGIAVRAAGSNPKARSLVIADAGHTVHLEKPDVLGHSIAGFVSDDA